MNFCRHRRDKLYLSHTTSPRTTTFKIVANLALHQANKARYKTLCALYKQIQKSLLSASTCRSLLIRKDYISSVAFALLTLTAVSQNALASQIDSHKTNASYKIEYKSNADKDKALSQSLSYKKQSEYKFQKDFSLIYTIELENMSYDLNPVASRYSKDNSNNDSILPNLSFNFKFGGNSNLKLFDYSVQVKPIINTTDVFNRYTKNTRYNFDFRKDGALAYEKGFENLSFAFAYGQAKLSKDPYTRAQQQSFDVQNTLATSFAYKLPVTRKINLMTGYSLSKNPKISQSTYNSDIKAYNQTALALTYAAKDKGSYLAMMYNKQDVAFNKHSKQNYYMAGSEIVYAYSFDNGLRFKTGFEQIDFSDHSVNKVVSLGIPVEINFKISEDFSIWTGARFKLNDEDAKNSTFIDAKQKNLLKEFNENSYTLGTEYKF